MAAEPPAVVRLAHTIPERCVHVGDRENYLDELFSSAAVFGTRFVVRTCGDRLAGDGRHAIAGEMAEVRAQGLHGVGIRDVQGEACETSLKIRYRRITVLEGKSWTSCEDLRLQGLPS